VGEKCSDKFRLEFDFHVFLEIFYMIIYYIHFIQYTYIYIYIYIIRRVCGTYRHDDDEARRNISVEQVVSKSPFQHKYYLQACEIPWKTADTTKY
jgi:hypothetical protein